MKAGDVCVTLSIQVLLLPEHSIGASTSGGSEDIDSRLRNKQRNKACHSAAR